MRGWVERFEAVVQQRHYAETGALKQGGDDLDRKAAQRTRGGVLALPAEPSRWKMQIIVRAHLAVVVEVVGDESGQIKSS